MSYQRKKIMTIKLNQGQVFNLEKAISIHLDSEEFNKRACIYCIEDLHRLYKQVRGVADKIRMRKSNQLVNKAETIESEESTPNIY